MNTQKTIIAASIAAIFAASGAAMAKEKWEYHEDAWGDTKSYGNTTVAQDSVGDYGPWKEFAPAAGPVPVINFLGASAADPYRTLPQTTQTPQPGCGEGAWCGYAALYGEVYSSGSEGSLRVEHQPYDIALTHQAPGEGWYGEGALNFTIVGGPGLPPGVATETGFIPTSFYGAPGSFYGKVDESDYYLFIQSIDGGEGGAYYDPAYVTLGRISAYISGEGAEGGGAFVAGIITPPADISALQVGKVTAYYAGYTAGTHYEHTHYPQSPFNMTVNFGSATWNGSWSNGVDGSTHTHSADSTGQVHVFGQVGFNASGTISGANIQSTSVSTADPGATVRGSVRGSFFGPSAAAVGGVADITKSNPNGSYESSGYTNARYVDVFVGSKVEAPK